MGFSVFRTFQVVVQITFIWCSYLFIRCIIQYKLLKKSMEYYFCLDFLYIFLHYIHMVFTFPKRQFISLHFAKKKHENRSGETRITSCQTLGVQIKSCRNSLSCKLNYLDCICVKRCEMCCQA